MNMQTPQDFNFSFAGDKPTISEPIPDGTILQLQMIYTPGGFGPGGALTKSKPTAEKPNPDTQYLKCEFTVLRGPYRNRKFYGNMTCIGGELDEKGQSKAAAITRGVIRLMLDSAQGLSSKDETPEASAKRVLPGGFASLQGIRFIAKVKMKPASGGYPAKNELGQVLTIDMRDYPKSEADLDNPVIPPTIGSRAAPPALPNPNWGATQSPVPATPANPTQAAPFTSAGTSAPAIQPHTGVAGFVAPAPIGTGTPSAPAPIVPPPVSAASMQGGIPAWAQAAA
jgi:hypothetical protein